MINYTCVFPLLRIIGVQIRVVLWVVHVCICMYAYAVGVVRGSQDLGGKYPWDSPIVLSSELPMV